MGTLYYLVKMDGSRETFALNKVYHYERVIKKADGGYEHPLRVFIENPAPLTEYAGSAEEAASKFFDTEREWQKRIGQRLWSWAGDAPILLVSEHTEMFDDLPYEKKKALITGSAYDGDYEDDGVTYKPGSAW